MQPGGRKLPRPTSGVERKLISSMPPLVGLNPSLAFSAPTLSREWGPRRSSGALHSSGWGCHRRTCGGSRQPSPPVQPPAHAAAPAVTRTATTWPAGGMRPASSSKSMGLSPSGSRPCRRRRSGMRCSGTPMPTISWQAGMLTLEIHSVTGCSTWGGGPQQGAAVRQTGRTRLLRNIQRACHKASRRKQASGGASSALPAWRPHRLWGPRAPRPRQALVAAPGTPAPRRHPPAAAGSAPGSSTPGCPPCTGTQRWQHPRSPQSAPGRARNAPCRPALTTGQPGRAGGRGSKGTACGTGGRAPKEGPEQG